MSPHGKMWLPKSVNKIFPSEENTNRWKTLVTNLSFKTQNKENAFGAPVVISALMNKLSIETC